MNMENETGRQFRLGIFVVAGTILFVSAMYFIGRNQNLFGPTIRLEAFFNNVNGLQPGNNVRFAGSDAGTVESVDVINDTAVKVVLVLKEKYGTFIKTDALASIGTDGLMGNKLVNIINNPSSTAGLVKDGSVILTLRPVETDEMLRTLNQTNEYVSGIALNLKNITDKIGNSRGTIWKLIADTVLSKSIDSVFVNMKQASNRITVAAQGINQVVNEVNTGKGLFRAVVSDTIITGRFYGIINALDTAGKQTSAVSNKLAEMIEDVEKGKGTLGVLLKDTSASEDLRVTISNLKQASESLNKSLEAVKNIPALKKYLERETSKKQK